MKLKFTKNSEGEIFVKVEEKDFSTEDYITMIKELKKGELLEVEFEGDISEEEKGHVNSMVKEINDIENASTVEEEKEVDEKINPDDIPF